MYIILVIIYPTSFAHTSTNVNGDARLWGFPINMSERVRGRFTQDLRLNYVQTEKDIKCVRLNKELCYKVQTIQVLK